MEAEGSGEAEHRWGLRASAHNLKLHLIPAKGGGARVASSRDQQLPVACLFRRAASFHPFPARQAVWLGRLEQPCGLFAATDVLQQSQRSFETA